ncbi:MAG: hypothetical protein JNK55_17770 [Rubrivivax sp.]|jgi:hypothetical protein|nr:hypothetical protein [Rubrivivax sp.]
MADTDPAFARQRGRQGMTATQQDAQDHQQGGDRADDEVNVQIASRLRVIGQCFDLKRAGQQHEDHGCGDQPVRGRHLA